MNDRGQKAVLSPSSDHGIGNRYAMNFQSAEDARLGEEIIAMFDRHRPKVRPKRSCVVKSAGKKKESDDEEEQVNENGKDKEDDDEEYMEEKDRRDKEKSEKSLERCRQSDRRRTEKERQRLLNQKLREARREIKEQEAKEKADLRRMLKNDAITFANMRKVALQKKKEAIKVRKFNTEKRGDSAKRLRDLRKRGREQDRRAQSETPRRPNPKRLCVRPRARAPARPVEVVRKRSRSESADLGRASLLEAKSHPTVSKTTRSRYLESMQTTVQKMHQNLEKTAKFFTKASTSACNHRRSFLSFVDPFATVAQFREIYVQDVFNWRQLKADHKLDLDPEDTMLNFSSWKSQYDLRSLMDEDNWIAHKVPELRFLSEYTGFVSLWDLQYQMCDPAEENCPLLTSKVAYMTRTFKLLIKVWSVKNPGARLPRVAHYFLFLVDNQNYKKIKVTKQLIRDTIFWLPIHMGDVRDGWHVPNERVLELAKQMGRALLNDWPLLTEEIPEDEFNFLLRLEAATMRMESSLTDFEDWLGVHPEDVPQVWNQERVQGQPEFVPLLEQPTRPLLRRSKSAMF